MVAIERWRGCCSAGVFATMASIWEEVGLDLSFSRSRLMNSRLVGQRSEAEVWPSPWEEQVGLQEVW